MIAHAGLAVTVIGITANTAWTDEWQGALQPSQGVELGGYVFTFVGAGPVPGPNYTALRGALLVTRNGRTVAHLAPETRTYTAPPMETTEAAIRPTWHGDLYAVIGDAESDGAYAMRLYFKPLVSWIWGGAVLMALGGALSLSERRRAAAAARREPAAVAARASEA
jgi:cytochrome c-type biogenesis protein CcmF